MSYIFSNESIRVQKKRGSRKKSTRKSPDKLKWVKRNMAPKTVRKLLVPKIKHKSYNDDQVALNYLHYLYMKRTNSKKQSKIKPIKGLVGKKIRKSQSQGAIDQNDMPNRPMLDNKAYSKYGSNSRICHNKHTTADFGRIKFSQESRSKCDDSIESFTNQHILNLYELPAINRSKRLGTQPISNISKNSIEILTARGVIDKPITDVVYKIADSHESSPNKLPDDQTIDSNMPEQDVMTHYKPLKRNMSKFLQTPRYYFNKKYQLLDPETILATLKKNPENTEDDINDNQKPKFKPPQYPQRSTQTGELVSDPNSKFMPTNIYFYPRLTDKDAYLERTSFTKLYMDMPPIKHWKSSRKPLCLCKMKL